MFQTVEPMLKLNRPLLNTLNNRAISKALALSAREPRSDSLRLQLHKTHMTTLRWALTTQSSVAVTHYVLAITGARPLLEDNWRTGCNSFHLPRRDGLLVEIVCSGLCTPKYVTNTVHNSDSESLLAYLYPITTEMAYFLKFQRKILLVCIEIISHFITLNIHK